MKREVVIKHALENWARRSTIGLLRVYGYAELLYGLRRVPSTKALGVRVFDITGSPDAETNLRKLRDALSLISRHAPRQFTKLRTDVSRIIVAHTVGVHASYIPALRTIFVDHQVFSEQPIATTSALIVHESTHARFGPRAHTMNWNALQRAERLANCRMRMFAQRLPEGRYLVEWADQLLAQARSVEADAEFVKRAQRDSYVDHLPTWLPHGLKQWLARAPGG